jgi:hypothetical protein
MFPVSAQCSAVLNDDVSAAHPSMHVQAIISDAWYRGALLREPEVAGLCEGCLPFMADENVLDGDLKEDNLDAVHGTDHQSDVPESGSDARLGHQLAVDCPVERRVVKRPPRAPQCT